MPIFRSSQEKRFWLYAVFVLVAILSTLVLGRPLQEMLRDQNTQAVFFSIGMLLTGVTILIQGLRIRPDKVELGIWIGLAAVYTMFIFRLGAPERSHLIEYSILAIFIYKALIERLNHKGQVLMPALMAFLVTTIIGSFDEGVQLLLPNRVFDPVDILFNCLAALSAILGSLVLQWGGKKFRKKK